VRRVSAVRPPGYTTPKQLLPPLPTLITCVPTRSLLRSPNRSVYWVRTPDCCPWAVAWDFVHQEFRPVFHLSP
jgi:hypothetical protein